jgi:hypothetical protein
MVAGVLIAFMFATGLFGPESAFIDHAARSDVKNYILDEDRQTEVLDLMKAYEKVFKDSRKKEKKHEKALEEFFAVRNSEISVLQSVFDDYMRLIELRQLSYMEAILKTKSIVTESEWENLLSGIDEREKMQLYDQDMLISKIETSNKRIESDFNIWIEDDKRAKQASLIMKEVNSSEVAILKKLPELNLNDDGLLRNKNATEEDYKKAFKENNRWWNEYFELYIEAYIDLSAVTTDSEWKIMKKYTKGIF